MKKIVVPSDDGVMIAGHFGKSTNFLVFETQDGKIVGTETRTNTHAVSVQGGCAGSGHQGHHGHGHEHNHDDVVGLLEDCSVVICHGMGHCAANALRGQGIEPIVVGEVSSAHAAVEAYLAGELVASTQLFCQCHG